MSSCFLHIIVNCKKAQVKILPKDRFECEREINEIASRISKIRGIKWSRPNDIEEIKIFSSPIKSESFHIYWFVEAKEEECDRVFQEISSLL